MKGIGIMVLIIMSGMVVHAQSLADITDRLDDEVEVHLDGITDHLSMRDAGSVIDGWYKKHKIQSITHAHPFSPQGTDHGYGIMHAAGQGDRFRLFYLCKKKVKGDYRIIKVRITKI